MDLSFEDQRRMIHYREHTYKDYIDVKYFVLTLKKIGPSGLSCFKDMDICYVISCTSC